ncbi:hypothetical protein HDU86_001301 [Geranomyces michiganensis]|nr:hypothetical protein HDU86_001301 [Geranomyces michiganensis]
MAGNGFSGWPIKNNRSMNEYQTKLEAVNMRMIHKSVKLGVTTAVSEMWKHVESGNMTKAELLQTVDEILFTNIDVTSGVMAWTLIQLAENPTWQERLRDEIRAESEPLQAYVKRSDTLAHRIYLESGRLRPVLWYSLPEVTAEAKRIQGYHIPAGTSVLIDAHVLNRTSPVWGKDGKDYNLDRFEKLQVIGYRYAFWRFGIGSRKCVGQYFGDRLSKRCVST